MYSVLEQLVFNELSVKRIQTIILILVLILLQFEVGYVV